MKKPRVRAPVVVSPFLSTMEAAVYLRLSVRALENYRLNGSGPLYRKHGNKVVYPLGNLNDWSEKREFKHTGGAD